MKKSLYLFAMIIFVGAVSGCANPYNNQGEGATLGGVLGATAGGIIGHQSHDTAAGMLVGGVLGAAGGAAIGSQIQKPEPYPYYPEQVVVAQPAPAVGTQVPSVVYTQDTVTMNVLNDTGGYTAVILKRSGNGYVGPQGEYYPQVPSMAQMKAMYGK